MTTISKIKHLAKKSFLPNMVKRGFQIFSQFAFVKRVGEFYHVIEPELLKSGENLRIQVFVWVPEIASEQVCNGSFPKFPSRITGGELSQYAIGHSDLWDVSNDEKTIESLADILACIDRIALPWFSCVKTRSDFIDIITPHVQGLPVFPKILDQVKNPIIPRPDLGVKPSILTDGNQFVSQTTFWEKAELLLAEMKNLGFIFEPSPRFRFYKKCGDIYHVVAPELQSHGSFLGIRVFTWVPEVLEEPTTMIPDDLSVYTGGLLGDAVGEEKSWFIANETALARALQSIVKAIHHVALPWFESISTREAFVEAIHPEFKPEYDVETSFYAKLVRRVLTPDLHSKTAMLLEQIKSNFIPELESLSFQSLSPWYHVYEIKNLSIFLEMEALDNPQSVSFLWVVIGKTNEQGYISPNGLSEEIFKWPYNGTDSFFDPIVRFIHNFFGRC